jgi:hypothetical protein
MLTVAMDKFAHDPSEEFKRWTVAMNIPNMDGE